MDESSDRSGADRHHGLARVRAALESVQRVVLTTHVNADGDGAGSEAAIGHFLLRHGASPIIVNPTPFPAVYAYLLAGLEAFTPKQPGGRAALQDAELFLVLDTSELPRLGGVAPRLADAPVSVLDHHPPQGEALGDPAVRDPTACATGELAYELLTLHGDEITPVEAEALYVAIATDTGSFRFSNTTRRAHEIAAALIAAGVDTGRVYRRLHAQYTPQRLALIEAALRSLHTDPELPIAWVELRHADFAASGATSEDLDGLVEYPRRLRGTEVAVFLRELPRERTKASLRSNGDTNVAEVALMLGGGGHEKAAGVVLDLDLAEATKVVLDAVRDAVRESAIP